MSQLKDYLSNLTEESKQQMRIKAKETKDAKKKWGEENLIQDFEGDEAVWRALASKVGIRLPAKYIPSSDTKHIKRVLKKLNVEISDWLEIEGTKSLKDFSVMNPTWPAYSHIGLVLEEFVV